MTTRTHKRIRKTALSTAGLLMLGLQVGSFAGTPADAVPNTSTGAITPVSVAGGSTAAYAYTLTNTSGFTGSVLPLGSALVALPAGWGQPTFGTLPAGWTVTANGSGRWCVSSNSGLAAGQSVTFHYTEHAQATAGTATFTTTAFVGNSCSFALGTIPYDGTQPSVTVDTLAYSAHSTSGVAGQPITPGFTVTATKADGSTDSAFAEPITLSLGANPGGAAGFSTTKTPTNGSAAFTPTISRSGAGYTVLASSDGSPGVASEPIYVVGSGAKSVACPAGQSCDTGVVSPSSTSPTAAEAIGDPGPASDVVSVAVGDQPAISCAGATVPSPAPLDVFVGDFNRHLTLKVLYDRDRDADPFAGFTKALTPTSAAWRQVCFQGSNDPTPRLLSACTGTDANGYGIPEPCIASELAEPDDTSKTADVLMVLSLNPDPDPHVIGGLSI